MCNLFVLNKRPKYETGSSIPHLTHIKSTSHMFGSQLSLLTSRFPPLRLIRIELKMDHTYFVPVPCQLLTHSHITVLTSKAINI